MKAYSKVQIVADIWGGAGFCLLRIGMSVCVAIVTVGIQRAALSRGDKFVVRTIDTSY